MGGFTKASLLYMLVALNWARVACISPSAEEDMFEVLDTLHNENLPAATEEKELPEEGKTSIDTQWIRDEAERNMEDFIRKGFQRAKAILELQDQAALEKPKTDDEASAFMMHHSRTASKEVVETYRCKSLGILETSKVVAKHFNIAKEDAYDILRSITIPEDIRKSLERKCSHLPNFSVRQSCDRTRKYRTIDGSCNNLNNPLFGSSNLPFKRFLTPAYEDGVSSPRGSGRTSNILPNPRVVSVALARALPNPPPSTIMTQMVKAWGQLLDHDFFRTPETAGSGGTKIVCCNDGTFPTSPPPACIPINVTGDQFYTQFNIQCLRFVRSMPACTATNCDTTGPREQLNQLTSYLDASFVYGSKDAEARSLRELQGGRLLTKGSGEQGTCPASSLCPLAFLPETNNTMVTECIAGDSRVNEQPGLTSMHTMMVRYHNKLVDRLSQLNPGWNDETLYQEARRIMAAMLQHITYTEFLPTVLGPYLMSVNQILTQKTGYSYTYNPTVDATHTSVFSTALFRFGHTLISEKLQGRGQTLNLKENFNNPRATLLPDFYPSHLLKGESTLPAESFDFRLVDAVLNFLFAEAPFTHGFDLMAFNIMRGREHGIPAYSKWRAFCGLRTFTSFSDLRNSGEMRVEAVNVFEQLYPNVNEIDLFPAAISEKRAQSGILGPTFACLMGKLFRAIKDGDRFWYENGNMLTSFTPSQLYRIKRATLATIICDTTSVETIQKWPLLSDTDPRNLPLACSTFRATSLLNPENIRFWSENSVR